VNTLGEALGQFKVNIWQFGPAKALDPRLDPPDDQPPDQAAVNSPGQPPSK
jgi:hypothetical protein